MYKIITWLFWSADELQQVAVDARFGLGECRAGSLALSGFETVESTRDEGDTGLSVSRTSGQFGWQAAPSLIFTRTQIPVEGKLPKS